LLSLLALCRFGERQTEEQWAELAPLVEACRPKGKTPPQDLRRSVEAVLWRHQNGAKWRGRTGVDRDLRSQGSGALARRDSDGAEAARARADSADDPLGDAPLPADDGSQERTLGRNLGRGGFRERRLDDPEGADDTLEGAQRLPVATGPRHHGGAQDRRGELTLPALLALRSRCPRCRAQPSTASPMRWSSGPREGLPLDPSPCTICAAPDRPCSTNSASRDQPAAGPSKRWGQAALPSAL